VFREAGIDLPDGAENLRDATDVADALTQLKTRHDSLRRAVVKLNEGFSGEGNAVFDFRDAPNGSGLRAWVMSGRRPHCKENLMCCLRSGASHVSGLFARCRDRWP
jgi:hypothetical protein